MNDSVQRTAYRVQGTGRLEVSFLASFIQNAQLQIIGENMEQDVFIRIMKSKYEMKIFVAGELINTFQVGIGENIGDKEIAGDKRTPEGLFKVVSIEDSSSWTHDFADGKGTIKNAYGPWFIRLSTSALETISGKTWIGIGIHGTHDPNSIGTLCTEGCIRLNNADLLKLVQVVGVGSKVEIYY